MGSIVLESLSRAREFLFSQRQRPSDSGVRSRQVFEVNAQIFLSNRVLQSLFSRGQFTFDEGFQSLDRSGLRRQSSLEQTRKGQSFDLSDTG